LTGEAGFVANQAGILDKGFRRILDRIELILRAAGSGFLFAVFGTGSVVLAHGVLRIVDRGYPQSERELRAQARIQTWFFWYVRLGVWIGILGIESSGMEGLNDEPTLIVANHPTLLDVVFLLSFFPQGDCVVKSGAWENPALRGIVTAAGYIPNQGGDEFIEACSARIRAGRSVLIFPEGSRSPKKGLGRFHRGAAHVALRTGCRILLVSITCDPPALKKGQPWYAMPKSRLRYSLRGGKPFRVADVAGSDLAPPLAARKVTEYMRTQFEAELGNGIV